MPRPLAENVYRLALLETAAAQRVAAETAREAGMPEWAAAHERIAEQLETYEPPARDAATSYTRRACLVLHAAGLTAEAASWRELAERSPERERVALLDVAEANEWLAGELTRLLATSAEAADLDTRHALPDRGEVDEPAVGDDVHGGAS